MPSEDWQDWERIEELYHAALEKSSGERSVFLAHADPEIRRQVEILLAQPSAGTPVDRPAWDGLVAGSAESRMEVLAPGHKLGNFEIVSLLGRGGMGDVYRAHDSRLKREVAIKILPQTFASERGRIARFEREARAASALNHPNIVSVFDVGVEGDTHWIASELVAGDSLQNLISRGPLAPRKAIGIAAQIAEGLAAAHAGGILHRDLKPGNIMVRPDGHVKILDFGLAKQHQSAAHGSATITDDLTDSGMIMGTVAYMSPEQVRAEAIDPRSDIFSLGLILHEMLSGKRTFTGDSSVEVMNAILKNDPPDLLLGTPPILAAIVARCLEKDRARRFHSAADLGFALSAVAAPAPVLPAKTRPWTGVALGTAFVLLTATVVWFRGHSTITAKPAEHKLTRLTANGRSFTPAISRDGKILAYAAAVGDLKPQIWVQQIAGGKALQITNQEDGASSPALSPDGTEVAYASHGGIYEVPALGGAPRLVANDGFSPLYTPAGTDILFLRQTDFWYRLCTVPRMGGSL